MKNIKRYSLLFLSLFIATVMLFSACAGNNNPNKTKANTDNLVKKVLEYDGDGSLFIETVYTYDKSGHVAEKLETIYYSDENRISKDVYTYEGDLEITRVLYDYEDGAFVKSFEHSNEYNEEGKILCCLGYDIQNDKKELFALDATVYDENGREIKRVSYMEDEGVLLPFIIYVNIYNDNDQVVKEEIYSDVVENEVLLNSYCTYTYNENGLVLEAKYFDKEDVLQSTSRYTYDENGKQIKEEYFYMDGQNEINSYKRLLEYDDKDRLVKEQQFYLNDSTNELELSYYTLYEY